MTKWLIAVFVLALVPPFVSGATEQVGSTRTFFIESSYDAQGRDEVESTLVKETPKLLFYADSSWWAKQSEERQAAFLKKLDAVAAKFQNKTYPVLTAAFGSEWSPGVDGDSRITVLMHEMRSGSGGYFRNTDEYLKVQLPESNEREMLYISLSGVDGPLADSLLAHEFMHLISFNQKERARGLVEDVWLSEARAEYAPTFLGYDTPYAGSYLENRVSGFLQNPSDSLTEWKGGVGDYGSVNMFVQYLVDHYGVSVLQESLHSDKVGIASLSEALQEQGFNLSFSGVFTDWTVAVVLNDCSFGSQYCFLSQNLRNIRLTPSTNFLPVVGESALSIGRLTQDWSGHWLKYLGGGEGDLLVEFSSIAGLNFQVPYLLQKTDGTYLIRKLQLTDGREGSVLIGGFGNEYRALILMPSLQSKTREFTDAEETFPFYLKVSIASEDPQGQEEVVAQLLRRISILQDEVSRLEAELGKTGGSTAVCGSFSQNLGLKQGGASVRCLQQFLKSQGSDVYPEGFVTGYFGELTMAAVKRFQEKYAAEILHPLGITEGTGFFGPATRAKANVLQASS